MTSFSCFLNETSNLQNHFEFKFDANKDNKLLQWKMCFRLWFKYWYFFTKWFAGNNGQSTAFQKLYIYNWNMRRIKESMLINSLNPSAEIDASKLLSPQKGLEIAECWKECNHMVRDMLKKATSKNTPKPPKRTQKQKSPQGKKNDTHHWLCLSPIMIFLYFHSLLQREDYCQWKQSWEEEALDLLL